MANLRDIKRRLTSVRSTRQITHTMEMVSTTKIMKALQRADNAGPYKEALQRLIEMLAVQPTDATEPLLEIHSQIKNALFIVVTSDRGLAGGFNVQVERQALKKAHDLEADGIKTSYIACGKKAIEFFKHEKIEPAMAFSSQNPTVALANQISSYVMQSYISHEIDLAIIWYQHAKNRMEQRLTIEELLPMRGDVELPNAPRASEALRSLNTQHPEFKNTNFVFYPSAEAVLHNLIPSYFRTLIYHALIDSEAAEHGARRIAMQAATRNADEIITRLSREYNRIRQSAITTELAEIVGGAEALSREEQ